MITIKIELSPGIAGLVDREIHITMDENGVASNIHREKSNVLFSDFIKGVMSKLSGDGYSRTAETYRCALNSFMRFRKERDLPLSEITQEVIKDYERHLKRNGLKMNTVSFYMRILRAVYNRAVTDGIVIDNHPFVHVYTGVGKTKKRALSLKAVQNIKAASLESREAEMARDLFLFSFYTRGMSFVDIAFLRKRDLAKGVLVYKRKKTGQVMRLKWERCMQEIVDKYHAVTDSPFLFRIIGKEDGTEMWQYRSWQGKVNRQLKGIGRLLGINTSLTMYVARHSWASIAKTMNIPLAVISDSMGHHSVKTTQIYLDSIDSNIIDEANHRIIKSLK